MLLIYHMLLITMLDLFCPNVKHIYTVWIVPYPLQYIVHYVCTENTNPVNKWPILAFTAYIYSVGGGRFRFWREFDWSEDLMRSWSTRRRQKKNCWSILAEVTNCKLWLLISSKWKSCHCFGPQWLIDNLKINILLLTLQKKIILISWRL